MRVDHVTYFPENRLEPLSKIAKEKDKLNN
jgi:hypothetical protein